ncbi:LysR family transcriptional regulator [Bordetella genomosp. 10]|uniref:LysR family transcriptional regulator n=1 Tax=Bordetella genomosp. 10 TaxID=1416804 RepID=A0A261S2Y3_9BORD|nr:LysR family transcriptional regulator [Bordetella genomosp. 10]OZI31709.1 LysR family transcriptional regulator [Bordetella genomosp. 10]
MNLSTRQLRAFVAAADHGNFTRAAADIGLSQPAFSALVKSLEEELGAQLFVRNTRNVELTPFGRLFDAFARRTLFETETALRDLRDYATGRVGKVHVAALPSIAANWLPPVLRRFREEYPAVTTAVSDGMSQQCVELLTHGEIDFALATTDHYAPDLRRELLWTDRFHLVCPRGHPLATTRKAVTLEQIARYPFINFVRHSSVRQSLDAAFGKHELNNVLELEHLATVSAMVENNVGITVVPTLTLYQFRRPALAIRDLGGLPLTREIYILSRKNKELSMPAQALHDMLGEHVRALGGAGGQEPAG